MRETRYPQQRRALTTAQGPVPARVVGTVVCSGVGGTVVAVGGGVVMFIDGIRRGGETSSSGVRVYTCCAPIDTFETPESFKKTENVL